MEENKLIRRKQDATDKRIVKIMLTTKGQQMREVSKKVVINFNETVRKNIPSEKLNTFFDVMRDINQILESHPFDKKQPIRIQKTSK